MRTTRSRLTGACGLIPATLLLSLVNPATADTRINRFPDDVPCDAVSKAPDGAWVVKSALQHGPVTIKPGERYKDGRVGLYLDKKCRAAPPR